MEASARHKSKTGDGDTQRVETQLFNERVQVIRKTKTKTKKQTLLPGTGGSHL
jgi:hypothetical protein